MINSYPSVKTKAQTIVITEKMCSKKAQKLTKTAWPRQGLNPQLGWLVCVVLTGMYHSKQQRSSYQLAITMVEFPDDVH